MSERTLSERLRSSGVATHEELIELQLLEARLREMEQEAKANEYALSQEANGTLCRCRYETNMMGEVPEGSFCPFCGYRRYELVITGKWRAAVQDGKEE